MVEVDEGGLEVGRDVRDVREREREGEGERERERLFSDLKFSMSMNCTAGLDTMKRLGPMPR